MNTTIRLSEILEQVVTDLQNRFAGYKIVKLTETRCESFVQELINDGSWLGYYENIGLQWEFDLVKLSQDWQGPNKQKISVNPHFDIIFADIYPNVFHVEVGFHDFPDESQRPTTTQTNGIDGSIWDLYVFYDTRLRDL